MDGADIGRVGRRGARGIPPFGLQQIGEMARALTKLGRIFLDGTYDGMWGAL